MRVYNPYADRNPVVDSSELYDRRTDLATVLDFVTQEAPQSVSLVGESRVGKTSLLYCLAHPNVVVTHKPVISEFIPQSSDYLFVMVDLQRLPTRTSLDFWRHLYDCLLEAAQQAKLDMAAFRGEGVDMRPPMDVYEALTSVRNCIKSISCRIIFLLDDCEILVRHLELEDADKLRSMAAEFKGRVGYVVAGEDSLYDLYKEKGLPEAFSRSSFPNLFSVVALGLLDEEGADALIRKPAQGTAYSFSNEEVAFVRKWAGRHPDIIKTCCFYLFEAKRNDTLDYDNLAKQFERDEHLKWMMDQWWIKVGKLEERQKYRFYETLIALAGGKGTEDRRTLEELEKRGWIEQMVSSYRISGMLFRNYLRCQEALGASALTSAVSDKKTPVMGDEHPNGRRAEPLTDKERRLFQFLDERKGKTCTKEELMTAIWGSHWPSSPDSLEQLVKRLRKKIEDDPGRPSRLLSVRGQGYILHD